MVIGEGSIGIVSPDPVDMAFSIGTLKRAEEHLLAQIVDLNSTHTQRSPLVRALWRAVAILRRSINRVASAMIAVCKRVSAKRQKREERFAREAAQVIARAAGQTEKLRVRSEGGRLFIKIGGRERTFNAVS